MVEYNSIRYKRKRQTDYLLGYWGSNTKLRVSKEYPRKMYYSDFDRNGNTETIIAIFKKGNYYAIAGLDALVGQLALLRKKIPGI